MDVTVMWRNHPGRSKTSAGAQQLSFFNLPIDTKYRAIERRGIFGLQKVFKITSQH